jgi:protein O-mannosyl-transferase
MNKLFIIILACVCFGLYFGYLSNGFVFDDKILVESNPLIKSARLLPNIFRTGIYEYWTGIQPYDRMYRPLQMLTYYLDYNLWGLNPAGFRLSNLVLHLLNSILVFYMVFLIFNNKLLAASSSVLFLVHPAQISTVAYISARGDLLSGFFILACCILFLRFLDSKNHGYYFFSILAAALALLSRENALLVIFFLSLIISVSGKVKFKYLSGFFILCVAYFGLRFTVLGLSGLITHPIYLNAALRLVNFCNIILHYVLLLFWPVNLRMFHSTAFINKLTFPVLFLVVVGLILLVVVFIRWRMAKRVVFNFSLFWFLLGITPVYFYLDAYPGLGKALMAESWLYLPSIGFCIAWAYICLSNKRGKLIISACVVILGSLVLANRVYWRDNVAFNERALQFLPENSIIQRNLAIAYIEEGNYPLAYRTIKKLEKYYADTPVVNIAWGQYYLADGEPERALNYYRQILGKSFFTNYSMSLCYAKLGDLDKAITFSQASFNLNPLFVSNILQLSKLYSEAGQAGRADKYFLLARELEPRL